MNEAEWKLIEEDWAALRRAAKVSREISRTLQRSYRIRREALPKLRRAGLIR